MKIFLKIVSIFFLNIGFGTAQDIFDNDTLFGEIGDPPLTKVSTINITGTINMLVFVVGFPDRTDVWPQYNNSNPYYPVLGAFPDESLLSEYINTNGDVDIEEWIKPMLERFYDVHSGGRLDVNVTIPKTSAGKCYTTSHDLSFWIGGGSGNNVIFGWNSTLLEYNWNSMLYEAINNLLADDPTALAGVNMIQAAFVGLSSNEFSTSIDGGAFRTSQSIHEPGNPSNVIWTGAFALNRKPSYSMHESLHVFGTALGTPSGFNGLPDRGYTGLTGIWNATPQYDMMYHNGDLASESALYGQRPLMTHDLLYLGWIDPAEIETITSNTKGLKVAPVTHSLSGGQLSDGQKRVFKVMIHENYNGTWDEYFLIEYRAGLEFDKNFYNIDEEQYNKGILITHILERTHSIDTDNDSYIDIELAVPYNGWYGDPIPNDSYPRDYTTSRWSFRQGEIDWLDDTRKHKVSGVTKFWYMPDGGRHYWETKVPANPTYITWDPTGGNWFYRTSSLKSDFFTDEEIRGYTPNKFTPETRPSTQDWDGNPNRIAIYNIEKDVGYMTFDVSTNYWHGNISSNTTWTASESPYLIGSNLTVDAGNTLTIDDGTTIHIMPGASLIINGTLNVNGTPGNKVTFTHSGNFERWNYIKFNSSGSGTISNADIEYSKKGLYCLSDNVTIEDCTIKYFSEQGIYAYNSDLTIDGCIIQSPDGASQGIYMSFSSPTITGTEIYDINGDGLYAYSGAATFSYGRLEDCTNGIKTRFSSMEIFNNYFENNSYGIRLGAASTNVEIHDNDFIYNDYALYLEQGYPSEIKWNNFGYSGGYKLNSDAGILVNSINSGNTFLSGKWNNFYDGINYAYDIDNNTGTTVNATGNWWFGAFTSGSVNISSPQSSSNSNAGPGGSLGKFAEEAITTKNIKPDNFKLEQNFPNPFNPSTVIRFHLPEEATVSITIYDMLGQVIKTFKSNTIYQSGIHQVVWDGTNESGHTLSSGIYFYSINAITKSQMRFRDSRKLVFMK